MASQDSRIGTVEVATDIFNEPRQITVSDAYDTRMQMLSSLMAIVASC